MALVGLVCAAIGAGVTVGVMVWEPWGGDDLPSATDRIAICEQLYRARPSYLDSCWAVATREPRRWECYARYPDSTVAVAQCLAERH